MRGHHQEAHMVGDIGDGHERAVVVCGAAELREDVVAAALAAARRLTAEILDDALPPHHSAAHRRQCSGVRMTATEAATISMKARLIVATSSPSASPRKDVAARSSVSCLIAG